MKWEQFKNRFKKDARREEMEVDTKAIWEAIESDVDALNREKPKRRRFILWLLLAGISVASLTWGLYSNIVQEETLITNDSSQFVPEQGETTATTELDNSDELPIKETEILAQQNDTANDPNVIHQDIQRPTDTHTSNSNPETLSNPPKEVFTHNEKRLSTQTKEKTAPSSNPKLLENNASSQHAVSTTERSKTIEPSTLPIAKQSTSTINDVDTKTLRDASGKASKPGTTELTKGDESQEFVAEAKMLVLPSLLFPSIEETAIMLEDSLATQALLSLPISKKSTESMAARKNKRKPIRFFIKTNGGLSTVNRNLEDKSGINNSLLQNRNQYEKPLEAIQYGLSFGLQHRSGFRVSLGLQSTRINERFDFTEIRIAEDSIMGIKTLRVSLQGDTIPIMGMIPRTTTRTSQIRLNNSYRLLDIPIAFAYAHSFNEKWAVGFEAIIAANISLKTKGSISDEAALELDIESRQSEVFKSSVGLNYQFGLSLSRTIADQVELELAPFVRFLPNDFSITSYAIAQKYTLMGANLGLRYRF